MDTFFAETIDVLFEADGVLGQMSRRDADLTPGMCLDERRGSVSAINQCYRVQFDTFIITQHISLHLTVRNGLY